MMGTLDQRPEGTMDRRTWIGWGQPVLPDIVSRLHSQFAAGNQWDMRDVLLVLPGGLAVRRLGELLALRAQEAACVLKPPEIVTVGGLPERLYDAKLPLASDWIQLLSWVAAAQQATIADLRLLMQHPPQPGATQQWLELAKILSNLHRELASDLLDFTAVAKALGRNHIETPRWQALARIQRLYLDELHRLQLWDIHTARQRALTASEAKASRQIIVVGCMDLNRVQRGFLSAVSDQVQVWVAAPPARSSGFDPLGCLEADYWQSQPVDLPPDCLLVGNTPSDQAELVAATLAQWGDSLNVRDVTLGVPDGELIAELRHRLADSGMVARFGPGEPLVRSQPAVLLALISRYMDQRDYSSLAALVRHPAVDRMLSAASQSLPDNWLCQLDQYYREALPVKLDGFVNQKAQSFDTYRAVIDAVTEWLKPLEKRLQSIADWVEPIRQVLVTAYQPAANALQFDGAGSQRRQTLDSNHSGPRSLEQGDATQCAHRRDDGSYEEYSSFALIDAANQIGDALAALHGIPESLQPKLSITEMIELLLRSMDDQLVAEPPDPNAVQMLGWLELAWDDAPALIITGLHDGVVPECVNADAFLPNQLRRQLGMLDNARRLARDVYCLNVMLAARRQVKIVVGKTDAAGDPMVPSRLLLACDLVDLPARVLHLVHEANADVLPEAHRNSQPTTGTSRLAIPRPENVEPPTQITVTAFRDYLRCPYRFYLRHILRLRDQSDADVELDASMFGNLVHAVLDQLAGSSVATSSDADEVAEFLKSQLDRIAAEQFGPGPPAAVLIQIEQAEMRLRAFATQQAARAAAGWEIRFTEQGSTLEHGVKVGCHGELLLIGRIDRIDYHADTNQWAIWDYKTSETAKKPESVHYNRSQGWLDLQLPLYIPIAKALGVTGMPSVGYINLPKRLEDVGFCAAQFSPELLNEAWEVANQVATSVANCQFWPEQIRPVAYDDYARICQINAQQVNSPPPKRKLFRFEGYGKLAVEADVVKQARQRLNQPASRKSIQLPPLMIRASAGTGKTFQLTNRLLQILLSGQDVDPILAATFTRKAAGEIMSRVLQRLALSCIDADQRRELAANVPQVDTSAAACLATLRRVTASIHRLRIGTLDSFFAQLAKTLTLDMGLPVGWSTLDPSQEPQMQMQAITDMLGSNDRRTLLELVRMLFKGESNRRLSDDIRLTVENGLEFFRCTSEQAWDQLPLPAVTSEVAFESALMTVESCRMSDKRINNELNKLHLMARSGDWGKLIGHTLFKAIREAVPKYFNKELPADLSVALEVILDRAAAEALPIYRRQTLATYSVLQAYDQSYQQLVQRTRSITFADVTHFLSRWLRDGAPLQAGELGMKRLEFRLDCSVQHLLLDEFQDTSLEQWDVLRPLAKPLGAGAGPELAGPDQSPGDRSFFCVGDSKQAIYSWRGGVAEIFDNVVQTVSGLESRDLQTSYRSSPQVMQAVNEVFQHLDRHTNYAHCEQTATLWSQQFPAHQTARQSLDGYVSLENGPQLDGDAADALTKEDRRRIFLEHAADRIAQLATQSAASIGVLFRTNDDVATMMGLLRERHVSASQDGGNPLNDSVAVELILSLVHLADHPGDGTCYFHIRHSPLMESLRNCLPTTAGVNPIDVARWFRDMVSLRGLGRAIEWAARSLWGQLSWWDGQRVEQLIRAAHAHQAVGSRLRDFESAVQRQRVALPSESQVKVMTIHKSKGLEFDAVFLPALDVSLTGSPPLLVARRPDPCQSPDGVLRYMSADLQALLPQNWQRAFDANKSSMVYEMLCVLYVAMTRARRGLYMIAFPAGKMARQDFSSLLHSTLAAGRQDITQPLAQLYCLGDAGWYRSLPK
ncbi:MAG: UvrD-helicase domain-containing protein [Pirellulaceae bacterium]|nr:UvrD-helicase domain-containing protein [Pirellulaceae bacterium]